MINTNISNIRHSALHASPSASVKNSLSTSSQVTKNDDAMQISEEGKSFSSASEIMSHYDVNNVSPREMSRMSSELYSEGIISFEEHGLMSFQPELNQEQYKKVTGNQANPDSPRDFISEWENRLTTQKKSGAPQEFIKKTENILALLNNLHDL